MPEPTTTPVALRAQRELTIRALCDHFAADRLEVAEFEHRLDLANRALTLAELQALTTDLEAAPEPGAPSVPAPAPIQARVPARPREPASRQLIVGIMGGATRRGSWLPAAESTAIAVMGGIMLDFREVQLPPGETVVHAFAFMGGVSIVVPPELEVTTNGFGLMGGFDHLGHVPANVVPNGPRLRIDGVAIMGGVDVQVKTAGEPTAWDSHAPGATQRHEVKQQLREQRHQLREEARRLKDEWRSRR